MQDEIMIKRLKKRDMSAFEEIVTTYSNYVGAIVKSRLSYSMEPEDVEEVVVDVFFALWKQSTKLNSKEGTIKNYLGMIARNKAINKLRERRDTVILEDDMITNVEVSPEYEVLNKESMEVLMGELNTLNSQDSYIFTKYHMKGDSINQIASEMHMNPNTVKAKLVRSRKKLKKQLTERGYYYEY